MPTPEDIQRTIRDWYSHLGRKAGSSRSEAKRAATRINAAKARAARAEKRKKALGK